MTPDSASSPSDLRARRGSGVALLNAAAVCRRRKNASTALAQKNSLFGDGRIRCSQKWGILPQAAESMMEFRQKIELHSNQIECFPVISLLVFGTKWNLSKLDDLLHQIFVQRA